MTQANELGSEFFLFPILSSFGTDGLWYVFLGVVLVFLFYSIFLIYHWFRYGMNILTSILATIIYSVVSGVILVTMIISFASLLS
ncbi:hypothetical protein HQ403_00645 [Candidatus Kaiserbacteria bacterium]|nr:hypothetical protein [Candidatus Kaiserbacteria bacterium]